MLNGRQFDVIISDFRMPGMNGRQFFEAVQQKSEVLASRIVFLTGDMVSDSTRTFLESIGNPHLAKPFHLANVRETIAAVIKSHHTEDAAHAA
jgi:CheY-like chemotaxis protein